MEFEEIIKDKTRIVLVEPAFPIPCKSRNHKNTFPVGLLKISSYLKSLGKSVLFIRMNEEYDFTDIINFDPDFVMITSIFTYWSEQVKDAVYYFKMLLNAPIMVGGIFASLLPQKCKEYTQCDIVYTGVIEKAEKYPIDYSLIDEEIDFQILHTTRGCNRTCDFCGCYIIEPKWKYKQTIKDEIIKRKLVFYDNNLLANPYIEDILNELIELKKSRSILSCESQSGFDGRILLKKPYLAKMLKDAGFKYPKIAWDSPVDTWESCEKQLDVLLNAGFSNRSISVFMLFNHDLEYDEMEEKRVLLFNKRIQVTDCRFRPLNRLDDNYNGRLNSPQTNYDYHINPNWTDREVKQFRRNVRRHNGCIRYGADWYSETINRRRISQEEIYYYREMDYDTVKQYLSDAWNPAEKFIVETDNQGVLL